jgi:hypothetical protein
VASSQPLAMPRSLPCHQALTSQASSLSKLSFIFLASFLGGFILLPCSLVCGRPGFARGSSRVAMSSSDPTILGAFLFLATFAVAAILGRWSFAAASGPDASSGAFFPSFTVSRLPSAAMRASTTLPDSSTTIGASSASALSDLLTTGRRRDIKSGSGELEDPATWACRAARNLGVLESYDKFLDVILSGIVGCLRVRAFPGWKMEYS